MSNVYGLAIDNLAAFELVLPSGTVTNVTPSNDDLWFAVRVGDPDSVHPSLVSETIRFQGGGNNFVRYFLARFIKQVFTIID